MEEWRLLDTGRLNAAENMALDDVILECRAKDLILNTIRFLQFDPPAALVGYHQDVEQDLIGSLRLCRSDGFEQVMVGLSHCMARPHVSGACSSQAIRSSPFWA